MRTTLTLEAEIAKRLKELAHRRRTSFKETVNDVLRRGLNAPDIADGPPFVVDVHETGFVPGVDPGRLNQLLDDLDVDETVARNRGG